MKSIIEKKEFENIVPNCGPADGLAGWGVHCGICRFLVCGSEISFIQLLVRGLRIRAFYSDRSHSQQHVCPMATTHCSQ